MVDDDDIDMLLVLALHRFQEEIQRLKDQLAGQGGAVDGDGESEQVRQQMSLTTTLSRKTCPKNQSRPILVLPLRLPAFRCARRVTSHGGKGVQAASRRES